MFVDILDLKYHIFLESSKCFLGYHTQAMVSQCTSDFKNLRTFHTSMSLGGAEIPNNELGV